MINKFEIIGVFVCVGTMALALFFLQHNTKGSVLSNVQKDSQLASVVAVDINQGNELSLEKTIKNSIDMKGNVDTLVSDDVVIGKGAEVQRGDTVSVHYIGTLQDGQEFDNSNKRGEAFEFTVGEGRVIKGWDQGVVGMKVGGSRILVIPADLAYGASAVGPIPANSTLVFVIELVAIQK
jgi:FKBP-type peptidyl-prolyl cis-trans isomerase